MQKLAVFGAFAIGALAVMAVASRALVASWRVHQLVGERADVVVNRLGPPELRWEKEAFRCLPNYECRRTAPPEGPVFFYRVGWLGYYLYFDANGVVGEVEANGS